jgi:multidrug resistance efflux pump
MVVRKGDLLADLDSTELDLAVQEAEEALAVNQALLDQVRADPQEQEVAIARAEYQRALVEH